VLSGDVAVSDALEDSEDETVMELPSAEELYSAEKSVMHAV
jgi:hypothetical protein